MESSPNPNAWRLAILSAIALGLLSLFPQINMWIKRGGHWQGSYATLHGDEFLYSGYLNALIEGRPRRNDPFTGSDLANKALPETTFSIQVVPAIALSSIARALGFSASTTFILLAVIATVLAALAVYWLLLLITVDQQFASVGVVFILCLGTAVANQGLIGLIMNRDLLIFGFPFLRRYQPAAAFFLFFVFSGLTWRALIAESRSAAFRQSIVAGLVLVFLVFSYLYLWTAAFAWLTCLAVLWLLLNPADNRKKGSIVLTLIGILPIASLVPYAYLVSHRAHTLDSAQTLIVTHAPDLFRLPEIVGMAVIVVVAVAWKKHKVQLSDARVVFTLSFALLPAILFNQQILTGRSMQPFHFEDFIANYVSLTAVVLVAKLLRPNVPTRAIVRVAALSLLIGIVEMDVPIRAYYQADSIKDDAVPVMRSLNDLPARDPNDGTAALVFSSRSEIMLSLPTWAPQGTLLGIGSLDFGTYTHSERKELFFDYLYFSGSDSTRLRDLFEGRTEDSFLKYYVRSAIFGHERALPSLSYHFEPIQSHEIEQAIKDFENYAQTFSQQDAMKHRLTYLITRSEAEGDLSRVDKWYERSAGERIGSYNLYKLKLRS